MVGSLRVFVGPRLQRDEGVKGVSIILLLRLGACVPNAPGAMFMQAGSVMNVHMVGFALCWTILFTQQGPQQDSVASNVVTNMFETKETETDKPQKKAVLSGRDFFALTVGRPCNRTRHIKDST